MTNPNAKPSFRLPHETPDAPRTPLGSRPRVGTTAHVGHDSCTVGHATEKRRSAYRSVAGLTTGIAVVAGLGALGTTWMAQQATTAAAATTVDAAAATDPLPEPSALPTSAGQVTRAPTTTVTKAASKAKKATKAAPRTTSASTRATATRTRATQPVVRVTAPAAANPVHAGTHSS